MRSAAEIRGDILSLRRVAISLREQRDLRSAMQCEAIIREREAELAPKEESHAGTNDAKTDDAQATAAAADAPTGPEATEVAKRCSDCELCRDDEPDHCGLAAHPHCGWCGHCRYRHYSDVTATDVRSAIQTLKAAGYILHDPVGNLVD